MIKKTRYNGTLTINLMVRKYGFNGT